MKTSMRVFRFKLLISAAGIAMVFFVVFLYFPYFGLWDESKIFENLDEAEIISRADQLEEVQMFLEKYPDAKIKVDWEHGQLRYVEEQIVKTKYDDDKRTLNMQIRFDAFANPSPYVIGCSGGNVSVGGFDDIVNKLQSEWCFDGSRTSLEDFIK